MTAPQMLTCKQAAPRLKADASTVGRYIRDGLLVGKKKRRRFLCATLVDAPHGGKRYLIEAAEVRKFNALRNGK